MLTKNRFRFHFLGFLLFLLLTPLLGRPVLGAHYYSMLSPEVESGYIFPSEGSFTVTGFKERFNPNDPRLVCGKTTDPFEYIYDLNELQSFCQIYGISYGEEMAAGDAYIGDTRPIQLPAGLVGWKLFIPPGTTDVSFYIYVPNRDYYGIASRFRTPPETTTFPGNYEDYDDPFSVSLDSLTAGDVIQRNNGGCIVVLDQGVPMVQEGGWLYMRQIYGEDIHKVYCRIQVNVETYHAWYNDPDTKFFSEDNQTDDGYFYAGDPDVYGETESGSDEDEDEDEEKETEEPWIESKAPGDSFSVEEFNLLITTVGKLRQFIKNITGYGIQIGDTQTCESGVIRFHEGQFQGCVKGQWFELDLE